MRDRYIPLQQIWNLAWLLDLFQELQVAIEIQKGYQRKLDSFKRIWGKHQDEQVQQNRYNPTHLRQEGGKNK